MNRAAALFYKTRLQPGVHWTLLFGEILLKRIARLACGIGLLFAGSVARAEIADFEFQSFFATGSAGSINVNGTFTGDLVDGRITSITNASVFRNGKAFRGNGSLFTLQYDFEAKKWVSGGYVSLDGRDNNIIFIDSDYAKGDASYFNFFFSITGIGNSAFQPSFYRYVEPQTEKMTVEQEKVVPPPPPPPPPPVDVGAVPEPATWAMLVLGFGAAGASMRRTTRRKEARRRRLQKRATNVGFRLS